MGCAIITELPARTPITTAELSLRLFTPRRPGGTVRARAEWSTLAAPMVLAEVEVRDDRELLVAHGSSLYMTLAGGTYRAPVTEPRPRGRRRRTRSLGARARSGGAGADRAADRTDAGERGRRSGDLMRCRPARGSVPRPPAACRAAMVAMLAEAAMEGAARRRRPRRRPPTRPSISRSTYLRPLASDGREARAEAHAVHAGRRIAVANAEVPTPTAGRWRSPPARACSWPPLMRLAHRGPLPMVAALVAVTVLAGGPRRLWQR